MTGAPKGALCGSDFDDLAFAERFRDGQSLFAESLDMNFDCFTDESNGFVARFANGDAAG